MNVFEKFDDIPSMILQDIKETKRYRHTVGRTVGRSERQRENSIPSHKHAWRYASDASFFCSLHDSIV